MNKEHFLIELKIYLKPLSYQHQAVILDKYETIFDERLEQGETEEQIAKTLGKPKDIAKDILKEVNIEVPEKQLNRDGWQEITPDYQESYEEYEEEYEHPYEDDYQRYQRRPRTSGRILRICGILALNFLLMFWLFFAFAMSLFGIWIAAAAMMLSPFLGVFSVLSGFNDASMFQLFASIFLSGAGIIGAMILIPVTKFFFNITKRYFQWNIAVLRGEI